MYARCACWPMGSDCLNYTRNTGAGWDMTKLAKLGSDPRFPLSNHPLIGRTVAGELRELVISYGKTGYVALYRFLPAQDQVRIVAIRHQRELDYPVD